MMPESRKVKRPSPPTIQLASQPAMTPMTRNTTTCRRRSSRRTSPPNCGSRFGRLISISPIAPTSYRDPATAWQWVRKRCSGRRPKHLAQSKSGSSGVRRAPPHNGPSDRDEDTGAHDRNDQLSDDPSGRRAEDQRQDEVADHRADDAQHDVQNETHMGMHQFFRDPAGNRAENDRQYPANTNHLISPCRVARPEERQKFQLDALSS